MVQLKDEHYFKPLVFLSLYLQYSEDRRLGRRGSLELGQPVPSLPGVSANLTEESLHVPVNQIPVWQRMSVCGRETPEVLLRSGGRVFPSCAGRFRAQHAALWSEHPTLPLAGGSGQRRRGRARQVLSCHHNGPTTIGTAVYFGHVGHRQSRLRLSVAAVSGFIHRAAVSALCALLCVAAELAMRCGEHTSWWRCRV